MKKFLLITTLFIGGALYAQNHDGHDHGAPVVATDSAKSAADMLKVNAMEHDFGKIPQGKPVTTEFIVTNTGTAPLKLENVQASCGCTTPVWDKDAAIAPGATAKITVGYNAAAPGAFAKPVTIFYNNGQTKQIFIKGEVWSAPAESAPANDAKKDF